MPTSSRSIEGLPGRCLPASPTFRRVKRRLRLLQELRANGIELALVIVLRADAEGRAFDEAVGAGVDDLNLDDLLGGSRRASNIARTRRWCRPAKSPALFAQPHRPLARAPRGSTGREKGQAGKRAKAVAGHDPWSPGRSKSSASAGCCQVNRLLPGDVRRTHAQDRRQRGPGGAAQGSPQSAACTALRQTALPGRLAPIEIEVDRAVGVAVEVGRGGHGAHPRFESAWIVFAPAIDIIS